MGRLGLLACSGAAVFALASTATAQEPAATVQGVTVTGTDKAASAAQQVERFAQIGGEGRLARWYAPVCPVTTGLPSAFGSFVDQRIRSLASEIGAPVAPVKCQANVLIMVTPTPNALANQLVEQKAHALAGGRWPIDKTKLHAFADDQRPVRWLFSSHTAPIKGSTVATTLSNQAASVASSSGGSMAGSTLSGMFGGGTALDGPPQYGNVFASRLTPAGGESISQVVIVVDANRIAGLQAGQVADYLSMVTLAQARAEDRFAGIDTVLNLFAPDRDDAHRPAGLRPWDTAYLKALYRSDSQISYTAQVAGIATRLKSELAQKTGTDGGR